MKSVYNDLEQPIVEKPKLLTTQQQLVDNMEKIIWEDSVKNYAKRKDILEDNNVRKIRSAI